VVDPRLLFALERLEHPEVSAIGIRSSYGGVINIFSISGLQRKRLIDLDWIDHWSAHLEYYEINRTSMVPLLSEEVEVLYGNGTYSTVLVRNHCCIKGMDVLCRASS
jgi:hypothetical protein